MRITQGIIYNNFIRNLDIITNKINEKFQEISSAKRITKPSDDPIAVSKVMQLKDELAMDDQYKKNIDTATGWMKMTESALDGMGDVLKRLEEIAISMGSDSASAEARKTVAEEVSRIKEHALMIANTRFREHFIFSGFLTDTAPFTEDDNNYHGDDNEIKVEVGKGFRISYNISGSIFTKGVNIFQLMDDLKSALNNNDADSVRALLDKIHHAFDQVNIAQTGLGARIKNLDNIKENLSNKDLSLNESISNEEDADMAKAIPKLYTYQSGYQALLHAFAKITSVNLFDIIG